MRFPYLETVLEQDPRDLGANITLGQAYLQLRRFDEAVELFRVANAAEPYNVSAAYNLGVALNRAGRREEAQQALEHFQELQGQRLQDLARVHLPGAGQVRRGPGLHGGGDGHRRSRAPAVSFVERDTFLVESGAGAPGVVSGGPLLGSAVRPSELSRALPGPPSSWPISTATGPGT